uniref:Macaca fascicularis brain cDNA clone: QmoA-10390, similar to human formin-like 2 (FMNL2), mRNA, RefSeq: NM_052905.1 n=1 Tax=Macaca fascicularis TaxID=9541 RepID=I7GJQ0_MACFA|nr:unnamed protein product [Macaca fascicularis]
MMRLLVSITRPWQSANRMQLQWHKGHLTLCFQFHILLLLC